MAADSESDFLDLMEAQTLDELDLTDPFVQETYDSFQKIETLFAKVRLPSNTASPKLPTEPRPIELPGFSDLRKLGTGGFGEVYRAFDDRLQRQVAIKIPRFDRITIGNDREDYLQEARMAAKLNHPGLVKVHDLVTEADRCLLISEYVEGKTLDEILKNEKLSVARVVDLAIDICEAIAHAHQRRVVHRDLKPANILIDSEGNPRITDFGLAIRDDGPTDAIGFAAGTIEYMSPEQLPGRSMAADSRADIWSFGVVLYQMLTHQLPFRGGARADVFKGILKDAPESPSRLRRDIPKQLETICLKCLQKNPSDRYASAAELATDLRALKRRLQPTTFRRRALAVGFIAVPIILAAAMFATQQAPEPAVQPSELIRVTQLNLRHFRYDENDFATDLGTIGTSSHDVRLNDDMRIEFRFDRPANFYLLEFTSTGEMQILSSNGPDDPARASVFPAGAHETIQLIDGTGLHAFVLLASPNPLPEFEDWSSQMGTIPWDKTNAVGVWRFSNGGFEQGHFFRERSAVRNHQKAPPEFERLCEFLANNNEMLTVEAIGFQIQPATDAK